MTKGQITVACLFFALANSVLSHRILSTRGVNETIALETSRGNLSCTTTAVTQPQGVYSFDDAGRAFRDLLQVVHDNPGSASAQSHTPAGGKTLRNTLTMMVGLTLDRFTSEDWSALVSVLLLPTVGSNDLQPSQEVFACRNSTGGAEFSESISWV